MTSSETEIRWEYAGAIATLVLNRPDKLNALTPTLLEQACEAVSRMGPEVKVLIVTGAGRAFCVGVDLEAARGIDEAGIERFASAARRLQRLFETVPQVVIAKVRGHCLTGGLELAIACDLIVAAEDARFGDTHAKVGYRPRWGMSQRLPRLIGPMQARAMAYTAKLINAAEAVRIGLILQTVPVAELDEAVAVLAGSIAGNNAGSIAAYKDLLRQSQEPGFSLGLAYEAETEYPISRDASPSAGR
jgi:enoyl-CoA hydratase